MIEKVLKLDVAGRPISWITREDGALLYALGNLVLSVVVGMLALVAGLALGRVLA